MGSGGSEGNLVQRKKDFLIHNAMYAFLRQGRALAAMRELEAQEVAR
jgi:hypothetical protein